MRCARLIAPLLLCLTACASVDFERTTQTSGTFVSVGHAFTIFSIDIPKEALQIARENAVDSGLAHLQVEAVTISPDWGWWNWALDILSVRKATLSGTWGFSQDD